MVDEYYGLIWFFASLILYGFILKKIDFPDSILSKNRPQRIIQAIIMLIILISIPFTMRLLAINVNKAIYYFVYYPLYIVVFMRVCNIILTKNKKHE